MIYRVLQFASPPGGKCCAFSGSNLVRHEPKSGFGVWLILLLSVACAKEERLPQPAFYHWEARLELSEAERALLDHTGARRLYLRFFDIDWPAGAAGPAPVSWLEVGAPPPKNLEVVPVVFITNQTFERLPEAEVEALARQTVRALRSTAGDWARPVEWQFDCDWTEATRTKFFAFIRAVKATVEQPVSVTIRLHQLRYPERTGIPPADRGMLMFYNMGDLYDWDEPNSILNLSKAAPYLRGAPPYPLPLDLALPAYRWGVAYRHDRLLLLMHGLDAGDLRDSSRFAALGPGRFELLKSTYIDGYYLYAGDRIRLEAAPADSLRRALDQLRRCGLLCGARHLAFYHLEDKLTKRYARDFWEHLAAEGFIRRSP